KNLKPSSCVILEKTLIPLLDPLNLKWRVQLRDQIPTRKQEGSFVESIKQQQRMSTGGEKGSATTKTPADFLKSIRGRPVVVKLNSGVDYRGILACLDGYMNIAMEQTEEYFSTSVHRRGHSQMD
ncbi:hypothetical protein Tsubulata_045000, partial [Turnera subulata]